MGITGSYYHEPADDSGRDRSALVSFDPRRGPRGRFPLILRWLATSPTSTLHPSVFRANWTSDPIPISGCLALRDCITPYTWRDAACSSSRILINESAE